jgi:hypothetical protein
LNTKRIDNLLLTIERNLTDWIPIGVKELEVESRAYCLFIWYQDYSSDLTPHIGIATQKLLDAVEATHFDDPMDRFDMIWRPQQVAELDVPGRLIVEDCYELLAESSGLFDSDGEDSALEILEPTDGDNDVDDNSELDQEFETLAPFREMMHRVGKNLKKVNWSKILPVTDDFVVVVSDYVGYWLSEDFEQCVDQPTYALLQTKNMLPPLDLEDVQ